MFRRLRRRKILEKSGRRKNYRLGGRRKNEVSKASRTYYLQPARRRKKIFLVISAAAALAGLVYFFCYSPFFEIETIVIERQKNLYSGISDRELGGFIEPFLQTRRLLVFSQGNALFFDKKIAERVIRKNLVVDSLKISRGFHKIKIKIGEKLPSAVLASGEKYYYVSSEGLVFRQVLAGKFDANLPLIYDQRESPAMLDEARLDEPTINFIVQTADIFRQKFNGEIRIASFEIADLVSPDLSATVSEGWKIYLDKTQSAEGQIGKLKLALDEKIKERRPELEYVKLNLGNRVDYMLKARVPDQPSAAMPIP